MSVTATISTKGRYGTTLSLALEAIALQTKLPERFILFEDGEHKDIRDISPYSHLLHLLTAKGINWQVIYAAGKGQVLNHSMALERAETDLVWRLDDDNVPEPTCLEKLLEPMKDPTVGAVGGLILDPRHVGPKPAFVTGKIEDISSGMNVAWYRWSGPPEEVDHLYSTFLYRVEAGRKGGGYPMNLSPVGHREETIFSYQIRRAGYKLLVTPDALTWHFREGTGGIRSYKNQSLWDGDEKIFQAKLKEWNVRPHEYAFAVLDCGLGDHIMFRAILPEYLEKNAGKKVIVAACYPEVFEAFPQVTLVSIGDAKAAFGALDAWDMYRWCEERFWKKSFVDALRMRYLS